MTLVFVCRGPPGCSERGYFTASLWKGFSVQEGLTGGIFPPGCFCAGLSLLCVTPLEVPLVDPLLLDFGTCKGNSPAASRPRPRVLGSVCCPSAGPRAAKGNGALFTSKGVNPTRLHADTIQPLHGVGADEGGRLPVTVPCSGAAVVAKTANRRHRKPRPALGAWWAPCRFPGPRVGMCGHHDCPDKLASPPVRRM
jgi:hypothetical protein